MVNRGPSTGCRKCRQRHINCDKTRPACRRCIIRGYACPGYQDICGGVVFKDESRNVVQKQIKKAHSATKECVSAVPKELRIDAYQIVIPFFFETHILPAESMRLSSRGHFDNLVAMYSRATSSSPLVLATFATANRAMASHLRLNQMDPWHLKNDIAAVQAVKKAVADPKESLRDETLLAVLCLDFGTQYLNPETLGTPSRAHLHGALALIHHRGRINLETPASRALFTATRNNALLQALWYRDQWSQEVIASFPDVDIGIANPITELHVILLRALKLASSRHADMGSKEDGSDHRRKVRLQLQERLDIWIDELPVEWKSLFESNPLSGSWPPPGTIDRMPCLHVASLLAQWLYTKFTILKSSFVDMTRKSAPDNEAGIAPCGKHKNHNAEAQNIAGKVCRLLGYLKGKFGSVTLRDDPIGPNLRGIDSGHRLSDSARVISLHLSGWSSTEFTKESTGCGGFDITPEIVEYLHNEHDYALRSLRDLPSHSRTASNIHYV